MRLQPPSATAFLLFLMILLAAGSVHGADPFAEGVRKTDPLTPQEQQRSFRLPDGFDIQLVAHEPDINKPMNMTFDDRGRLWVTTSREYPFPGPLDKPGRDRVMIFDEFGAEGRAGRVTQFADGLNIPIGVYPFRSKSAQGVETWKAVVWSIPNNWLFEDTDGDGRADRRDVLYGPFDHTRDTHGNQASFRRGWDGWLYATHGYNNHSKVRGRDGHEVDMQSGNTYRMRLDGARIEQYTWGQVNPYGLAWDSMGNLYSSDCHTMPIYQLLAGGYYPSFGKPHDGLGFAPELMRHSHGSTAIDGVLYYSDDLWPEDFKDNIFVGNVMTSRVNRDRAAFHGSSPEAVELDDFVKTEDPWFRPVDLQLGPDGAFYIADFYNRIIGHYEVPLNHPGRDRERGRIWRVVYKGKPLRPGSLPADMDGLVAELGSPSLARRMLAMNALADRFGKPALSAVQKAFAGPINEYQSVHALWLTWRFGSEQFLGNLQKAARSPSPLLRVHAQRIAKADLENLRSSAADKSINPAPPSTRLGAVQGLAGEGLRGADPLERRCAAEAIGAWPLQQNIKPLLTFLAQVPVEDTHLRYVVLKSIRDHLKVEPLADALLAETWTQPELHALANAAVAVPSPAAGAFLIRNRQALSSDPKLLQRALQHAARYAPVAALDELALAMKNQSMLELGPQMELFQSLYQGLEQRGTKLSPELLNWGRRLAASTLSDMGTSSWSNIPMDNAPDRRNPWAFQDRAQADGGTARLLSSFPNGESLTGTLVSPPFAIPPRLSFFLCGHDGFPDKPAQGKNGVRLRDQDGTVLLSAVPPRNDTAQKIVWDLKAHAGKTGRFEVFDGDTAGAYAWLAFGRFDPPVLTLPATEPASSTERIVQAIRYMGILGPPETDLLGRRPGEWVQLLRTLANTSPNAEVRIAAIKAVVPKLSPEEARRDLGLVLENGRETVSVREVAGESLAAVDAQGVIAAMKTAPRRLNERWAQALAATPQGGEALVAAASDGRISPQLLQNRTVRDRLLAGNLQGGEQRLTELTRNLAPTDNAIEKRMAERAKAFAGAKANPAEGQGVFDKNCGVCHQIGRQGGLIGPQLDGIGNRGLDRLLEDILDPNRNVDRAFRSTVFVMKDGDVVSGLFRREEGELIVLADSTGKEVTLRANQVGRRQESATSLMPENLGDLIPAEAFNDLLAYLLGQSTASETKQASKTNP